MTNATDRGRADLTDWLAAQPTDWYAADPDLAALIRFHGMLDREPALHAAGTAAAGPLDRAAQENDLPRNHPVLDDWDGIGRFTGGGHLWANDIDDNRVKVTRTKKPSASESTKRS